MRKFIIVFVLLNTLTSYSQEIDTAEEVETKINFNDVPHNKGKNVRFLGME